MSFCKLLFLWSDVLIWDFVFWFSCTFEFRRYKIRRKRIILIIIIVLYVFVGFMRKIGSRESCVSCKECF